MKRYILQKYGNEKLKMYAAEKKRNKTHETQANKDINGNLILEEDIIIEK